MQHLLPLVVALLQAAAPAPEVPAAPGAQPPRSAAEIPLRPKPALPDNVSLVKDPAAFEAHVAKLVDRRAEQYGGPTWANPDARLAILRATVRTAQANPGMPMPKAVVEAESLEAFWGASTAYFTLQLMEQIAQARPGPEPLNAESCVQVCDGLMRAAGADTILGLTHNGWTIPDDSGKAIRAAADAVKPRCVKSCTGTAVPAPMCVAGALSQADLEKCWTAP